MQAVRNAWQLYAVGAGVFALGAASFALALLLPEAANASVVGPRAFPLGIAAILMAAGLVLLLDARAGRWTCEAVDPEAPPLDFATLGILVAGMVLNALLIARIGFILSATLMYVFTARAFGARRLWLAALVGFALAFAVYFGFARLLDLRIGGGLIEDLF
jgi:putative tricarboxylic transport membrane protein